MGDEFRKDREMANSLIFPTPTHNAHSEEVVSEAACSRVDSE